jgi:hypothetical protein
VAGLSADGGGGAGVVAGQGDGIHRIGLGVLDRWLVGTG